MIEAEEQEKNGLIWSFWKNNKNSITIRKIYAKNRIETNETKEE